MTNKLRVCSPVTSSRLIEWFDARVGKSLSGDLAGIDVPVKSWGIYI